ncbi:MAG: hypothetical protein VX910_09435 [Candidatus Latescibacterota bacterium]|nr:hypothetical protein [Candidatus Latescibacterota bacterium]
MARGIGKGYKLWFRRFCAIAIASTGLVSFAVGDTSIVLQGYQIQSEKYAANTVDAYVKALNTRPGSEVVALRPQTQPGWEGGESYTEKAALLSRLKNLSAGKTNLVLFLVGDADGPDDTFRINAEAGVSATELANAVSDAGRIGFVSAGCNSIAMDVAGKLSKASVSVTLSGISTGSVAHIWPQGNRGQYDLFSRYLIEGFYLQATGSVSGQTSDLIGKSYWLASLRTGRMSGGSQETSSRADYGVSPLRGPVVSVVNQEYQFNIQDLGSSLVGYVSNSLGIPVAPIQSAQIADGVVSFSFVERGRERAVLIADAAGVPAVTIDGKPVPFVYRPIRIDLISETKHIGVTYVTPKLGSAPATITYLSSGKSATKFAYELSSHTLSTQLPKDSGSLAVKITFGSLGSIQVKVGQSSYRASQVLRYGLYGVKGDRLASAVAVLSGGKLTGEVLPSTSKMRLPIDARVANGALTGSASLAGNIFTFSAGRVWESNRPPAKGILQSDYFDLPLVSEAFADGSAADGRVEISWRVDSTTMSDAVLDGDLRFQVVRTDRFSNNAVTFDVPAGRRQYTDLPSGDVQSFDYSVRTLLDHRVTTYVPRENFVIVGDAVAAVMGKPALEVEPTPVAIVAVPVEPKMPLSPEELVSGELVVPASEPVVGAPGRVEPKVEEEKPQPNKKLGEREVAQKEKTGLDRLRKKQEGQSLAGKVVYGLLGLMIAVGLAIAVGGGGGPNDLEPG